MKKINKPDVNAPRYRKQRISVLKKETLKSLKKKHPKYSELTLSDFKKIITTFNQNVGEGMIKNREGVDLLNGLGLIFMGSCPKSKKVNIDFQKSFKYGVQATHKNWDSDNKLLKIFYSNHDTRYSFKNKQVWSFKAGKELRKKCSDAFKENHAKYIEVPNNKKISAIFEQHRNRNYGKEIRNKVPELPEDYNEFEL